MLAAGLLLALIPSDPDSDQADDSPIPPYDRPSEEVSPATEDELQSQEDQVPGLLQPAGGQQGGSQVGSSDASAPEAPTGLSLTGSSTTSLSLSWIAATDNVAVTGYTLYLNSVFTGTTTGLTFTFTDLACGSSYTLGVDAYDAAGNHSVVSTISATTATCPLPGNVFVAPAGSDGGSNCVRFAPAVTAPSNLATVCASFGRAYQIAQPGDTVVVTQGTYSYQVICKDGPPPCEVSAQKGGPEITFVAQGGKSAVTVNSIELGANVGAPKGDSPSHLIFDGFTIDGHFWAMWDADVTDGLSTDLTFKNGHVFDVSSAGSGSDLGRALVHLGVHDNFRFEDSEIGPACCSADLVRIDAGGNPAVESSNVVFEENVVHDGYDTCTVYPSEYVALYGACSGTGGGDDIPSCGGIHVDGFHIWAVNGLDLIRNQIYRKGDDGPCTAFQPVFVNNDQTSAPGTQINDLRFEGNTIFGGDIGNNALSIGCGAVAQACTEASTGPIEILYNTVWGNANGFGNFGIADNTFAAGTVVRIVGNIAKNMSNSGGCTFLAIDDVTVISPTYANNLFGNRTCHATDTLGSGAWAPVFFSTNENSPNLHLNGVQIAVDGGEATYCPALDVDGQARPQQGECDIGADETLLDRPPPPPFPQLSLLDDFNRANNETVGPNYSADPFNNGRFTAGIASNTLARNNNTPGQWWNVSTYGSQMDMTLKWAVRGSGAGQYVYIGRITNPDTTNADGYVCKFVQSTGTASVQAARVDNGTITTIGFGSVNFAIADGDSLGFRYHDGKVGCWSKAAAGAWTERTFAADATYQQTGYPSMQWDTFADQFDDLSAGSIP